MNNFDYNNLTPFKWFVLENFPFIENDFEAINNYRLFSKVVEYLNNTIDNMNLTGEQMENVTNAMSNLQNYVNNYFDNLDVQDEINNKLDEMVEDGTLQDIIYEVFEERPYIVTIGDSFGDPNAGGIDPLPVKWPVLISNALNYRLINKCKSGCGFTYSEGSVPSGFNDNTFKSQLLQAEAQLGDTEKLKVKKVVIYGGVNDYTRRNDTDRTQAIVGQAIVETVRQAHNSFPNAEVTLIPFNVGYCKQERFGDFLPWISVIMNLVKQISVNNRSVSIVDNAFYWLVPHSSSAVFQSDLLHPNQDGQHYIANYIVSALTGSYSGVQKILGFNKNLTYNNTDIGSFKLEFNNGKFYISARLSQIDLPNNGNNDIVSNYPSNQFGTGNSVGLIVELKKESNYTVYYLAYSGTLRIITNQANVHINDLYLSGVADCF